MRTLVVYSSRTGNTKKIADAIYEITPEESKIAPVEYNPDFKDYDFVVLGFWVDKGLPDKKAQKYLRTINRKKIGNYPGT
ncbi:MAG: hypothetical protein EF813_11490 [Methanosarcinales archaeon]|nr:MAG: hypothetical protein EF813_11490 [Methanosarcinales archaeon]